MSNKMIKPVSLAVGAAFLGSLAFGAYANPGSSTGMQATDMSQGYMLVGDEAAPAADKAKEEGKCGEGKCGADKAKAEAHCGAAKGEHEGACGGDKAKEEGKCGEGKCGADKAKAEGSCGGDKAKEEGKCGGDKAKEGKCGGAA